MSHPVNDIFVDEVMFHIDYWTGTPFATALENAYNQGDTDRVREILEDSRMAMFYSEYQPDDNGHYQTVSPLPNGVPF